MTEAALLRIAMTDAFVDSLARLDASGAKRTAAFLDKLIHVPDASSLNLEFVHDAGDRAVRSMRVSADLRAIVCIDEGRLVLLHVAHHDDAYEWARTRCVRCHPLTGALEVVSSDSVRSLQEAPPESQAPSAPAETVTQVLAAACIVVDRETLCDVLEEHGIEHGLRD